MLLDCGYTTPPQVWKHSSDANDIDLIYISHAHADHYFGLPGLLGRMWEDGRTKPLTILTQKSVWESVEQALTLGYRSLRKRYQFELRFADALDGFAFADASFRFAPTKHSSPNLAVRIESAGNVFCYSGDGAPTPQSIALFQGSDVLVHEAFGFEPSDVHATFDQVFEAGSSTYRVALVHVSRLVRRDRSRIMQAILTSPARCILPEPGDTIPFG